MREKYGIFFSISGVIIGIVYFIKSMLRFEVDMSGIIVSSILIGVSLMIFFVSAFFLKSREIHEQILYEIKKIKKDKEGMQDTCSNNDSN